MTSSNSYSVVSLPDIELLAQIDCTTRRLVVISPGLSEEVANAVASKWRQLGPNSVHVVLDLDPEVCRLGFGDLSAVAILHEVAGQLGTTIHQQQGLRVGVVVTDETTTVFSPVPRLVEAGGKPGERLNALRFDTPIANVSGNAENDLRALDLKPKEVSRQNVENTTRNLEANPPVKFDLAQKVRVFNSRFEFVELKLHDLFISRKQARIPSDLVGLARNPKAQEQMKNSFNLVEKNSVVSERRITQLRKAISDRFLIQLPGYGTVVLRARKPEFIKAVELLKRCVELYKKRVERQLQAAIDANREILVSALLPSVLSAVPTRWKRFMGDHPSKEEVELMLRRDLANAFGASADVLGEMEVTLLFKGVTYELLNDKEFFRVASENIPNLEALHDEFDAAKAKAQTV